MKSLLVCRAHQSLELERAGRYRDKQSNPDVQMTNATVSDKKVSFEFSWL
jgi:hypothetical protein